MNFVFGAIAGTVVTVFVMDPALLSSIFHYMGDLVSNKELHDAVTNPGKKCYLSSCVVG